MQIRERALGPAHRDVAADVAALAAILDGQGRHREAANLYKRALRVFRRIHGPDHHEIVVNLGNFAANRQAPGALSTNETTKEKRRRVKKVTIRRLKINLWPEWIAAVSRMQRLEARKSLIFRSGGPIRKREVDWRTYCNKDCV